MTNELILYWNQKAATVLNVHTNPGDDSRRFAIIQIAIHDVLNSIQKRYHCYALKNEKDRLAAIDVAISWAACIAISWAINDVKKYVQENNLSVPFTNNIEQWAVEWLNEVGNWYQDVIPPAGPGERLQIKIAREAGERLAEKAFDAIKIKRANDGRSLVTIVTVLPVDGTAIGEYQSSYFVTPPDPPIRLLENWGRVVHTFVLPDNSWFRQPGPNPVDSNEYTIDYNEVKDKGSLLNSTRTPGENALVDKWNNLNQHIVWNNFTVDIIKERNLDAWDTARVLALIHTAMADGATAMFNDLYHFNRWRPVTAIRFPDDGNPDTDRNDTWKPYKVTPRVPEYPSAFGILGAATGRILQFIFSYDAALQDRITNAVTDNAISKIYCGWNFRKTAVDSIQQGTDIGKYVFENEFRPRGIIRIIERLRYRKYRLSKNTVKVRM